MGSFTEKLWSCQAVMLCFYLYVLCVWLCVCFCVATSTLVSCRESLYGWLIICLLSICHGCPCASQDRKCFNIYFVLYFLFLSHFFLLIDPRKASLFPFWCVMHLKGFFFFCYFNYSSLCDLGYFWRLLYEFKLLLLLLLLFETGSLCTPAGLRLGI